MNKKYLPIVVAVVVLLLGVGGVVAWRQFSKPTPQQAEDTTKKKKVAEPTNVIPVTERPYVQIMPLADGRNLEITVNALKKPATSTEYELEYQAGSLLQGAFGNIELATVPATSKILLGSCSAGGSCTYHEDVKGGSLVLRFTGPENYALKQEWKYIDNKAKETAFSSKDAKFQIDGASLKSARYLVVYNTPGYPEGLEGTLASETYSLTTSTEASGKAKLTIRANEEGALSIVGYDGKAWKLFETTVDGKMATADVEVMELYAVIKK